MDAQVTKIMTGLVSTKGMVGTIAKLYLHDEQKARQFIKECGLQTHNASARRNWGERLTKEIELFCKIQQRNINK